MITPVDVMLAYLDAAKRAVKVKPHLRKGHPVKGFVRMQEKGREYQKKYPHLTYRNAVTEGMRYRKWKYEPEKIAEQLGLRNVNVAAMGYVALQRTVEMLIALHDKYGFGNPNFGFNSLVCEDLTVESGQGLSSIYGHYAYDSEIGFNSRWYGPGQLTDTLSAYKEDVRTGFHPDLPMFESIAAHEYGHALFTALSTSGYYAIAHDLEEFRKKEIESDVGRGAFLVSLMTGEPVPKDKLVPEIPVISKYARKNREEYFAENFAWLACGGDPDRTPGTRFINDWLKKVKGKDWTKNRPQVLVVGMKPK